MYVCIYIYINIYICAGEETIPTLYLASSMHVNIDKHINIIYLLSHALITTQALPAVWEGDCSAS